MTNSREQQGFPPRGWVDLLQWHEAYRKSDPGDFWHKVTVNFVPHIDQINGDLEQMMSVKEHTALLAQAVREARGEGMEFALMDPEKAGEELGDRFEQALIKEARTKAASTGGGEKGEG